MQPQQHISQTPVSTAKPFWQSEIVILLAFIFLWPIGLYLMWKYTQWKKWVKITITVLSLICPVTYIMLILLIWGATFGLKTYSYINYKVNPPKINTSTFYNCQSINSQWGKCVYKTDKISFEYPANWNYIEDKEAIEFSPITPFNPYKQIVQVVVADFQTERAASNYILQPIDSINEKVIKVNNFNADITDKYFSNGYRLWGSIQHGTIVYTFSTFPDQIKSQHIPISDNDLRGIFYHMFNSFEEVK